MKGVKKASAMIVSCFCCLSAFAFTGLPVYDSSNFTNQMLQLVDSGKQVTNTIQQVEMLVDQSRRIYKGFAQTYEDSDGNVYELVSYSLSAGSQALKSAVSFAESFGAKTDSSKKRWLETTSSLMESAEAELDRYSSLYESDAEYVSSAILSTATDFDNTCREIRRNIAKEHEEVQKEYEDMLSELEEKKADIKLTAYKALSESSSADEALTTNTNEQKQMQALTLAAELLDDQKAKLEKAKKEYEADFKQKVSDINLQIFLIGTLVQIQVDDYDFEKKSKVSIYKD